MMAGLLVLWLEGISLPTYDAERLLDNDFGDVLSPDDGRTVSKVVGTDSATHICDVNRVPAIDPDSPDGDAKTIAEGVLPTDWSSRYSDLPWKEDLV